MKALRNLPIALTAALGIWTFGVWCSPALAQVELPGWHMFADTYPTNLELPVSQVDVVKADEATFTLSYKEASTETPLRDNASDAEVQAALEGLSSIGAGNVRVTGATPGTYEVTFTKALGNMQVAELEASGAEVTVSRQGASSGTIGIEIFNIGAGTSSGRITFTDTLPEGVKAKRAGQLIRPGGEPSFGLDSTLTEEGAWLCTGNGGGPAPGVAGASIVTCTDTEPFAGGGGVPTFNRDSILNNPQPAVGIQVEAQAEASGLTNHAAISGGGALEPAATEDPVTVSSQPAHGGLARADAWLSSPDGEIDTQAGTHPYTASFIFNAATAINADGEGYFPGSEIRDLETKVPPGLIGDLHELPQCSRQQLISSSCPPSSMVGLLKGAALLLSFQKQVFNMVPPPGVPAELGFEYANVPVYISFHVETGGDYAIVAHVNNIPQRELFQSILTLWGIPAELSHNRWRSREGGCSRAEMEEAFAEEKDTIDYCTAPQHPILTPFMTAPTQCAGPQQYSFRELSGWQEPDATSEDSFPTRDSEGDATGFTGCESLIFEPSIKTSPDTARADTPAGLTVDVRPPLGGLEEPGESRSSADIEDTVVALPPGFVINPGQAAGLQACLPGHPGPGKEVDALTTPQEQERGEEDDEASTCPNASKVGTVTIKSPLLEGDPEKEFQGNVYVLQSNPPHLRLLVAASADGVNLKLVGDVSLCEAKGEVLSGKTCAAVGQLIAAFNGTPQLPFNLFELSFNGGPQAALDTPTHCGVYTSDADFTPWSSPLEQDFLTTASFALNEGANGSPCPGAQLPFDPTLSAGSTNDQAGQFTGFSMRLAREDDQQRIEKLQFKVPAGLSGLISSVPLCDEADANAGTCPVASHVGHTTVASGPGSYPLVIPQPGEPEAGIYLTGPYRGAPFGLSIVTPVIAGPFNLGTIVTRAKIEVDPLTAQITITTDPLPQVVKGVPTDLRQVQAVIDRPGFMFNPTNCKPSAFSGTAWGTAPPDASEPDDTASLSSNFGVGSCRSLEFKPKVTTTTGAHGSRRNGSSLSFKISYPAGAQGKDAWFEEAKFDIPKQLPARLSTIQQACLAETFETDRSACPKHSVIGHAVVKTQVLPTPLEGPVYFVSYGGAKFPDAVLVLDGDNVHIELRGETFINAATGVTSATFKNTPDVPFESIEVSLPAGEFGEFGANLPHGSFDFCGRKLTMPTFLKAQNGLEIKQSTPVQVTGCPKPTEHKAKRAQRKKR